MQPHDNDQRPEEGDTDGGRDLKLRPITDARWLELAQAIDMAHGQVRVAEPGKPLDLFATLGGSGGLKAG